MENHRSQGFLRRATVSLLVDGAWRRAGGLCREGAFSEEGLRVSVGRAETATLRVRSEAGGTLRPERARLDLELPLLNYGGVVVPDCGRHYVNASKALDIRAPVYRVTGSNAGHPFLALADEAGRFLLAFGLLGAPGEVEVRRVRPLISSRKALVGGDEPLVLCFEWRPAAPSGAEFEVEFFSSESDRTWFHALRRYAALVREREGIAYPEHPGAWSPTWCTWTAFGSHEMSQRRVLENARVAREMGIGTVIIDDGWFGPGLDDDTDAPMDGPGTLTIGDYEPDPSKFPDLAGLVGALQAMGMRALLWHAPLCVARGSRAYARLRDHVIRFAGEEWTSVNGMAMLCPASPRVREHVALETERLLRDYGVDGLKVDLYNCLPAGACESREHEHDVDDAVGAVEATMAAQWERARAARPDVLFELKQDYGNVRLARYGTMVRAGDTAYDVDTNCRRCFYTQACAPCVHNDYLITGPETSPRSMGLMMVKALAAGVPTFGNDLTTLGRPLREVIGKWLRFYDGEKDLFKAPREPQTNDLSAWQGGTDARAWVAALWHCAEIRLPAAADVIVMNGTDREGLYVRTEREREVDAASYDFGHAAAGEGRVTLADGSRLDVPRGGYVRLRDAGA